VRDEEFLAVLATIARASQALMTFCAMFAVVII